MSRRAHKASQQSEPKPVPLESLSPELQAVFASYAETYRAKHKLPADAPMMVVLPDDPTGRFEALLFAEGSLVTSEKGYLDLGIQR